MPGIAGFFNSGSVESPDALLEKMEGALHREEHFTRGSFVDREAGVYICWTAHKDAFDDGGPWENEGEGQVLIFSGEDFRDGGDLEGFRRARSRLSMKNAHYVACLVEGQSKEEFSKLNGWFSGVFFDRRKGLAHLFTDRFGIKKFFCFRHGENLFFSNELNSLVRVIRSSLSIDPKALAEYLTFGCITGERSWFREIQATPGGALWTWSKKGGLSMTRYFQESQWETQEKVTYDEYFSGLRRVLQKTLPRYFRSSQKIGFSLTGGFDTRMVLANYPAEEGELPCYTFDGADVDTFDTKVSRKVARFLGQSHDTIRLDDSFFKNYGTLVEDTIRISGGYHNACGAHDLFFNRLARQIAPVRLTGKFGSEILRGFSMFHPGSIRGGVLHGDLKPFLEDVRKDYEEYSRQHPASFSAFRNIPWNEFGKLQIEQSQTSFRTPYMDNELVAYAYRSPSEPFNERKMCENIIRKGNDGLFRIRTDRGYAGGGNPNVARIIQKYNLFSFKLEWYFNEGMPDWIARLDNRLKNTHLDRLVLGHHKFLFYRKWFRDELSEYVRDTLLDEKARKRPYLNGSSLEKMVKSHLSGNGNFVGTIDRLLSLEVFHRLFVDRH